MSKSADTIQCAGVRLTSPDKVLFTEQGITKRQLAEYYQAIAPWILPELRGRPLTLLRCPRGRDEKCFVQRRASDAFPSSLRRVQVPQEAGGSIYLVAENLPALISLVQLGVLELHTWGCRRDRLERPDRMILDLDPDPNLPFSAVRDAALRLRERLRDLRLTSFAKTTGGKGLHVVVPLVRRHSWDDVREFSRALAEELEHREPSQFLAHASKTERAGKIFVDYLRNSWSASTVAAYSTRARPGAPVSTPVSWQELSGDLHPNDFTLRTVPRRLSGLSEDPWKDFTSSRGWLRREAREALGISSS